MTQLRLHTCVLLASLSSARYWSEHGGLGRALYFQSRDMVHFVLPCQFLHLHARRLRLQCIHPQSCYWPIVPCEPGSWSLLER